jgi:hypothetical protein
MCSRVQQAVCLCPHLQLAASTQHEHMISNMQMHVVLVCCICMRSRPKVMLSSNDISPVTSSTSIGWACTAWQPKHALGSWWLGTLRVATQRSRNRLNCSSAAVQLLLFSPAMVLVKPCSGSSATCKGMRRRPMISAGGNLQRYCQSTAHVGFQDGRE